jgi:hypothetical protein
VPWLQQYQQLYDRIQSAFTSVHLVSIPIRVIAPGSGTTTLLRAVAARLAQSVDHPVYFWTHSGHGTLVSTDGEPNWMQLVARTDPTIFLLDRGGEDVFRSLHSWMEGIEGKMCGPVVAVFVAGNQTLDDRPENFPFNLEPFLHEKDVDVVCSTLATAFPHSREALEDCRAFMQKCSEEGTRASPADRHMFVYCLTAMRGCFTPLSKLLNEILAEARTKPDFGMDLVTVLVYLSAFSTAHECAQLPLKPFADFLGKLPLLSSIVVWNPSHSHFRIVHPIIGRFCVLQLQSLAHGASLSIPTCDFIVSLHEKSGQFLRLHLPLGVSDEIDSYHKNLIVNLVVSRFRGHFFSPLMGFFVASDASFDSLKKSLDRLLSCKFWCLQPGYKELQMSRVMRQFAFRRDLSPKERSSIYDFCVVLATEAAGHLKTFDANCNQIQMKARKISFALRSQHLGNDPQSWEVDQDLERLFRQQSNSQMHLWKQAKLVKMAPKYFPLGHSLHEKWRNRIASTQSDRFENVDFEEHADKWAPPDWWRVPFDRFLISGSFADD